MNYSAKSAYQSEVVVNKYDQQRFTGFRGAIVRYREERIVAGCLKYLKSGGSILDIPTGTGRFAKIFLDKGFRVSCGDISKKMLEKASALIGKPENLVELKEMDIEKLPYGEDSFDLVFTFRLFQHLPHSMKATICKELHRVSKQYVVISFADTHSFSFLWRSLYHKAIRKERHPISETQFSQMCKDVGFRAIRSFALLPVIAGEKVLLLQKEQADRAS